MAHAEVVELVEQRGGVDEVERGHPVAGSVQLQAVGGRDVGHERPLQAVLRRISSDRAGTVVGEPASTASTSSAWRSPVGVAVSMTTVHSSA